MDGRVDTASPGMETHTLEWHSPTTLTKRLKNLVPRTTLISWIGSKRLKTHGTRPGIYAFTCSDLDRIEVEEALKLAGRVAAYTQFQAGATDPAAMNDEGIADAYLKSSGDARTALWPELSKRMSERGYLMAKAIETRIAANSAHFDTKRGCSTYRAGAKSTQRNK